jgi:hypothetical protein
MSTVELITAVFEDDAWTTLASNEWTVYEETKTQATVNDSEATLLAARTSSGYTVPEVDFDVLLIQADAEVDLSLQLASPGDGDVSTWKLPKDAWLILPDRQLLGNVAADRVSAGTKGDVTIVETHTSLARDAGVTLSAYRTVSA